MDQAIQTGLDLTIWLQTTYPQFEGFFYFITNLGLEEFYLAMFPLIFWCIHKELGKQLGYIFLFGLFVNGIFKQVFRGPRPFWVDPSVGLDTREEGYGIPSGHTQLATIFYFFLAAWVGRVWLWAAAVLIVFLMGLSRIYLGAHFLHDVIAGFLLSVLILVGFAIWRQRWADDFGKRILGQRLLAVIFIPVVLAAVFIIIRLIIGPPNMNVTWAELIPTAERSSINAAAQAFGVLLGFGVGFVLEGSRVRFSADGPVWQRVVRYIGGMVVLIIIWAGLGELFPRDPLWLAIPLRVLRYFLVLIWVSYYAPLLFVKLSLAGSEPDPGIDLTIR
ncbi:MAG: phosphatase PAP2 family protein [Chloroflexi bacterium]|nr:phosphatase PAP2 family protein [Chloroflexota bacterium]